MTTKTKRFNRSRFMILTLITLLLPSVALPASSASSTSSTASTPSTANAQAITEVAAGKRSEARASWWGFDPADATAALQAAINSGARKLIIENMGAPWITDKIILAGDQEIVFEKGVVVQAKRGAFHGSGDSLFSATSKKNITLTGHGATLRMWKQDYDDKTQYTHAEWRHALSFKSCAGVRVEGLTLADSGGDGIYLGVAQKGVPCSDVVITSVACVNNYRQGISVISARNLLIEDCVLKDTGGTAPEAGIDFEPNAPTEELTSCVMRNCISENNKGDAYTFYLRPLRADSKPLSIRLENCRAIGCRRSVAFVTGNDSETASVKGAMDFIACRFEGSRQAAISISDKPTSGARVSFVNCEVINPAIGQPGTTPIVFSSGANGVGAIGGVRFDGCAIFDSQNRLPMSYQDMSGGVALSDITGAITVKRDGQQTTHQLTPKLIAEWMPFRSFKQIARFNAKDSRYEPVFPDAKPGANSDAKPGAVRRPAPTTARQRGLSEWLLWAEANEQVSFDVLIRPVGKGEPKPVPVSVISPSGKLTKMPDARGEKQTAYEFKAAERGAYKIVCEPQNFTATVNSASSRICLYSQSSSFHFLGTTGQFYFWVPAGAKEFAVKVSGGGGTECVKAALLDLTGAKIEEKDNIAQACQFLAAPEDAARGEIWSLRLDKPTTGVLEDFFVQLQGIPPLLSPTREGLLKPAN
ncbi:MAG: right-handed parallel beta-helix repeat-containing protein [Candidatus Sumerlaeota bacterium]|nr:right-handed parallel beta-helix repeat-containing protein [Candidatus Sumerlaeota bacterium]